MLDEVGTYTSEQLAAASESMTSNVSRFAAASESTTSSVSRFAADLRTAGKIFGVRFGREWHYPQFQFDASRQVIPEMKEVLRALSPDEQGWDRLQWFLESHEELREQTPLSVWSEDRRRVIEAANAERWDGRD